MKVLLVDDDQAVAQSLTTILSTCRYVVDVAFDGITGIAMANQCDYDIILLDVLLPKLDGISLCRKLRNEGCHTPILMLTAQTDAEDIVMGLDAGADDYVTKPFEITSLLARLRALQRRGKDQPFKTVYFWGDLKLDPVQMRVTYQNQEVHLSHREYNLLKLFLANPQRIFTRDAILDKLWDIDNCPSLAAVTNLVKDLRQKLRNVRIQQQVIKTVHGLGYQLNSVLQQTDPPSQNICNDSFYGRHAVSINHQILEKLKTDLENFLGLTKSLALALQQDVLTPELQHQVRSAAHSLALVLDGLGYWQDSKNLRTLEHFLSQSVLLSSAETKHLSEFLDQLCLSLAQPLDRKTFSGHGNCGQKVLTKSNL